MIPTYDIAIIGAGPGGCTCALALHKSGLRVALIDKETFPRDKPCGDAIPGKAFKAIDEINPEWGKELRGFTNKTTINSTSFSVGNGRKITVKWSLFSYNSRRLDFDNNILKLVINKTQTTLVEGKRLCKVSIEDDQALCLFEDGSSIKSAVVIGCDGAYSIVKRQLVEFNKKKDKSGTVVAVRAYLKDVEDIEPGVNEVHYLKKFPRGYFWIFPLENGLSNVGYGALQNDHVKNGSPVKLQNILKEIITTYPEFTGRLGKAKIVDGIKGFALPLGIKKRVVSGHRFMLCGDAASLVDPFAGDGIDNAMWSGLIAAKQATMCIDSSDFTAKFMAQYDTSLYKKLGPELIKSKRIMQFFVRFPKLVYLSIWMASINGGLFRLAVRVLKI